MEDRMRGIVTSFLLAVLTNRAFLIDHPVPVHLAKFFESSLNWEFNASLIEGMNRIEEHIEHDVRFGYRFRTDNFQKSLLERVFKLHTNLPVQMYLTWNPFLEKEIRKYHLDKINHIDLPGAFNSICSNPREVF
jgi:hypothetical protein